jgi:nucleotide-binding universal stress UspA family protein
MFKSDFVAALEDYKRARRKAAVQELLAKLTGTPDETQLLSYDDVRQKLQAIEKSSQRLEDIPLDAIVGSVGRYHDFNRKFLPKSSISQDRWAVVKVTSQTQSGLPPIEVYQIGGAYFVKDGNHRVSVARQMGNKYIQAYVTEVETRVDLTPEITPDEVIIKGEQVRFLEKTKLDQSIPDLDISATTAGAYPTLLEHIAVHRYYMGIEQQREIPFEEASEDWYKKVFTPVVNIINHRDLLHDFPDRTAVDLYLWAADHRASLSQEVGWDVGSEAALSDIWEKFSPQKGKSFTALLRRSLAWLIPDVLEGGPPSGTWRERLLQKSVLEHLFNDLTVAVDSSQNAWKALEMAILLAGIENSRIHGIHIESEGSSHDSSYHDQLQVEFTRRCQQAGVGNHDLTFTEGEISKILLEQANFADLVILPLNHPPEEGPLERLSSGITTLIRNCPVPLLTVPDNPTRLHEILLAFDGSIKSREAMYLAAYLGTQRGMSITVMISSQGVNKPGTVQDQARSYLSKFPLKVSYLITDDQVANAINKLRTEREIDLVMMGGYGGRLIIGLMLGSVLDQVLREVELPVLICR